MTINITAALITAALLGLCFSPTRWMGIIAIALLTFDKPWLAAIVALSISIWLYLFKLR